MAKISIIIPARNEQFLASTVADLFEKAMGEIEVIVVLEGYWPEPPLKERENLIILHNSQAQGMRSAINTAAEIATGKYLMKSDAHCMFAAGFDEALKADCEPDWVAVPRRYSLDPENWTRRPKKYIDYLFLCFPDDPNDFGGPSLKGKVWGQLNNTKALEEKQIDDLMSAQGSCWFMHREYFYFLDLMDDANYGHFSNEFQEIGLKCWLSGGRVVRNKKTWYAHLHKGHKYGRGWPLDRGTLNRGAAFTNRWMDGRNWRKQDRDIRWLVQKFWPVPTWPETAARLVFHRRGGGSGLIRGTQIARHFKARLNPEWTYENDVHVWVKQQPPEPLPPNSYLDILDASERVSWLLKHPECGVIASSKTGYDYLRNKLNRDDIHFIPQHHCNFERVRRNNNGINVAGVVGGLGAIQCDLDELKQTLDDLGLEFRWLQRFDNVKNIVDFYQNIDVQIVWRKQDRPLKNPLKIINALSFGIPTVGYPEIAYQDVEGYYWPDRSMTELRDNIELLRRGFDADLLASNAEEYHIEHIAKLYEALL